MDKAFLSITIIAALLMPVSLFSQNNQVSVSTELKRLNNIIELPAYIKESEVHQISSYDRTGGNNDGFEGTYSYLRKTDDGALVIFEAAGKGVIERIWTPTPTDDTLDFYFDGSKEPSYSIRFRDLFSGNIFPFVAPVVGSKVGGFYSYLPIPFSNGCKIVFRGPKILFHQIQYRKYADKYNVKTFNPRFTQPEKDLLQRIANLWNKKAIDVKDVYDSKILHTTTDVVLQPGQSAKLADIKNGGRIVGIEFDGADVFEGLHNLLDLKAVWDGESSPAIYAPVADFFGFAFGSKSMQSLLLGVDSANRAYSFIPMPFDRNARMELVYRKKENVHTPVRIRAKVYYSLTKRNPEKEGKFYANWKRDEPALDVPYVFLEGKGQGHYIGTILQSQGKTYTEFTEFFEGDDSTVIDGINSIHGTGSEDYFNGGWYAQPGGWVERLGTPLHGCLDYSLPFSRTGGYRLFITDKMPFSQAIYHSIEHGPVNNNRKVDYISIAMYYSNKPVQKSGIPTNATSKVFIPDTLTFYSGLMKHLTYEGKMKLEHGNAMLNKNEEGVMQIDVTELQKGRYALYLNLAQGELSGSEIGLQDEKADTINWNKAFNKKNGFEAFYIGQIKIEDPQKPVRVYLKANQNKIDLNRVTLVKQ